ncbi:unnamed protein product [Rotaria sordida]|uniref:Tyrosine-protein kinase n=1 Tax=Rotaria sordida TaxID=392033 RepID=A0A819NQN1_9BILA|nr:unnamed protein product [Rotaria sordida]
MKSFEHILSNEKSQENNLIINNNDNNIDCLLIDQLNISKNINSEENSIKIDKNKTSNLPYYYNDIDRNKSESILRLINRPGCFLIRQHDENSLSSSLIKTPYVLSIVNPSLKISHYLLYRINKRLFIKPYSNQYYYSIKDLVDAHQLNPGLLPCSLVEYPIRLISNNDYLSSSSIRISSSYSLTIQTNKLIRQKMIGQGHFGTVYKGLYYGNIPVAIKTYSTLSGLSIAECESNLLSEGEIMMNLRHPYLVNLYGICRFDNKLCLITEYINNGCLLFWLHKQEQTSITNIFRNRLRLFSFQICDAMSYLEDKLIIHRDLAARNCLIDDYANKVKVSDFGMAKLMSSSSPVIYQDKYHRPFPLRWSSPEVLLHRKYSSKSDVWSYGILIWEIYSLGQTPFGQTISNDRIAQLIISGSIPTKPTLANKIIFQQLILPCWTYKVNDRPSFSSLKQTFNKIVRLSPRSPSYD